MSENEPDTVYRWKTTRTLLLTFYPLVPISGHLVVPLPVRHTSRKGTNNYGCSFVGGTLSFMNQSSVLLNRTNCGRSEIVVGPEPCNLRACLISTSDSYLYSSLVRSYFEIPLSRPTLLEETGLLIGISDLLDFTTLLDFTDDFIYIYLPLNTSQNDTPTQSQSLGIC